MPSQSTFKPIQMQIRIFISLSLASLLSACTATGPIYQTPPSSKPGYATLVVSREEGAAGSARSHRYFVDKTLVAQLSPGGYTYLLVKEGSHRITYGTSGSSLLPILVPMQAGEIYYYMESMEGTGVTINKLYFRDAVRLLPRPEAEGILSTYRYSEPIVTQLD
jgi:hypothetical protein